MAGPLISVTSSITLPPHAGGNSDSSGSARLVRITLTLIAVVFIGLFVLLPLVNVFVQAFSHGTGGYVRTFFAAPPPHGVVMAIHEKLEMLRASSQAKRTRSAIAMTLLVGLTAAAFNTFFAIAAAWAVGKFKFKGLHENGNALPQGKTTAYVRPHDVEISRQTNGTAPSLAAEVISTSTAGPTARVYLKLHESTEFVEAELTRERYQELKLTPGENVVVSWRKARIFSHDYTI